MSTDGNTSSDKQQGVLVMSVRALIWFVGNGQDANEKGTY
jgi:hypothetical protein